MNPIERVKFEGLFHPLIEAGSLTHIWLGESKPSKESLANFVIKTFKHTQNDQIAFSPEFTTCLSCGKTGRGLSESLLLLRVRGNRRNHPHHRLFHQDIQLEQRQTRRTPRPVSRIRAFSAAEKNDPLPQAFMVRKYGIQGILNLEECGKAGNGFGPPPRL